jgi:hypothetical protein
MTLLTQLLTAKRDIIRHMALLTQLTAKRDIIRHMALLTQLLTAK